MADDTLYGTAPGGCIAGNGSVFAVKSDSSGFTVLHTFTARITDGSGFFRNVDGAVPQAPLLLSGNVLYGAATEGGQWGNGVVFAVRTDGTGFGPVHTFTPATVSPADALTNTDGWSPQGHLILSGETLYGTTAHGGAFDGGTVFAVNTNGANFRTLHSFTATSPWPNYSNSDGFSPQTGLVLSSNTLYGVAAYGGTSGSGTVFAINTNGSNFRTLHDFSELTVVFTNGVIFATNSDGVGPYGALVASANMLYGTTFAGGYSGGGTVFAVKMDGSEFRVLHSFTAISPSSYYTNSDGASPYGGLILSGDTLYATAYAGGSSGAGTVFLLNTDGTGFRTLYSFTRRSASYPWINREGAGPKAELVLSGDVVYGSASIAGPGGSGTLFGIKLQPQLAITQSQGNIIFTWPTNATGFVLQSTTNLISPVVWSTVSPPPVVVSGLNTVTNQIYGTQRNYRLSQ